MSSKAWIWLGLFVGSTLGGFIPSLFGADLFSFWPQVTSAIGGALGIWAGFRIGKYFFG